MADIVITEFMDEQVLAQLSNDFEINYNPSLFERPIELINALKTSRGLIVRNNTQVTSELLKTAAKLRVIGRLGVGLDNIDLVECAKREIVVCPAHGANARAVAEYVIATAFLLLRGAYQASGKLISGAWPREQLSQGQELGGKTLGLIGFGSVGQEVARLSRAVGLCVCAYDPMINPESTVWEDIARVTFVQLLEQSDVVSLHVPLTDETQSLLGPPELDNMKQGAILINTARGGIVDEIALVDALKSGRLAGAALDVFSDEPLSPTVARHFDDIDNLILTPHIAGLTMEANKRVSRMTVENVARVLREQP